MELHLALYEPEIPPNTGNIIRLVANMGAHLHLIEPMGFSLSEKQCRRAGLDYHALANVTTHACYDDFLKARADSRLFVATTKTTQPHSEAAYEEGDTIVFGPESRGLPMNVIESAPEAQRIRIPMLPDSRSLNLSNAVAVVAYEAWRQFGYL